MMYQVPSYPIMLHFPDPPLTPTPGHVSDPQAPTPHPARPFVTSPFSNQPPPAIPRLLPPPPPPQVTSPDPAPQPQVTSPHLLSPPLYQLYNRNCDSGFQNPDWRGSDAAPEPSSFPFTCQNQPMSNLNLQNENQFAHSMALHHHGTENPNTGSYTSHRTHAAWYQECNPAGAAQDPWRSTLPQLQSSPQGSTPGDLPPGRWSCLDFVTSPGEEAGNTQFYHNNTAQPFCSPTTPGPSPHYPQTPSISSPHYPQTPSISSPHYPQTPNISSPHYPQTPSISSPTMHPREERLDLLSPTHRQLGSCGLQEYDGYPLLSDLHQSSQHLLPAHSGLIQDHSDVLVTTGTSDSCFSPAAGGQEVSGNAQSTGPPAASGWTGGKSAEGGGAAGGNVESDWSFTAPPQPKSTTKQLSSRLLCLVCHRDFQSLPALNGHMRSHSGTRSASWLNKSEDRALQIPVTSPFQSSRSTTACRGRQRRRTRPPTPPARTVLYSSLLRQEPAAGGDVDRATEGDEVRGYTYTPPPMLCPLRAGPGLNCSLTSRRQQRVQTVQLQNAHDFLETASPTSGTLTTKIIKPRINVGRDFQADIPPLQEQQDAYSDSHNALLLWTVQDELQHPDNQLRIEALVMMAHSSVVPGGGASSESALQILSECSGDFLLTVEKLLSPSETSVQNTAQQYRSVSWSAAETRLLVKSLQLYCKDFSRIQKAVQTKSISQCVEFYYLWKKKLNLKARTPAGLTVTLPAATGKRSTKGP